MRILSKYIALEFTKLVGWLLLTFSCIYLVVELGRIDGFMERNAGVADMVSYYVYKTPLIIFQSMPIAVLIAIVFAFGSLVRYNELTAMKANGISIYQAIWPALLVSLGLSVATFFFNEHIVPYTNKQLDYVYRVRIKKEKPRGIFQENNIWYRGRRNIFYNFGTFVSENTLSGVVIYKLDDRFSPVYRIDAKAMTWKGGHWVLTDSTLRKFGAGGLTGMLTQPEMLLPDSKEKPDDFAKLAPLPETMSYRELKKYISSLEKKGYNAQRYKVDLHAKIAFPFVSLIMALMGIPFSLRLNRSGGWAIGFGMSIILGFVCWVMLAMGLAMGHGGVLPPVVAAWGANILFGVIGIFMLTKVQ